MQKRVNLGYCVFSILNESCANVNIMLVTPKLNIMASNLIF